MLEGVACQRPARKVANLCQNPVKRPSIVNPYRTFFEAEGERFGRRPLDLSSVFPAHPDLRNYMIVIAGRCGSTWLGRMLEDLRLVGAPGEYFNTQGLPALYRKREAKGLEDYVRKTAALHPVFGFQINPARLFHLEDLVDFRKSFAGFAMIDLRRRDFVAQAFSFARASKSGNWHNVEGPPPEVTDRDVWSMVHHIIQNEQQIDKWYALQKRSPLRLVYEDILADRDSVILRILFHISRNGTLPAYTSPPQRQRRNGDGAPDTALLGFLQRNMDQIEQVHQDRARINTAKFIPAA